MNYLAADTETYLIGTEHGPFPNPVCIQIGDLNDPENCMVIGSQDMDNYFPMLFSEDITTIWHNAIYDLQVIGQYRKDLLPAIFKATSSGRVKCTMIREMMLNLAEYGHPSQITAGDSVTQISNSLADCVMRYFGVDLSEDKTEDSWRTNYAELVNIPVSQWPTKAYQYAHDDPMWAAKVYAAQESRRQEFQTRRDIDPLKQENFRVEKALDLSFCTNTGMDTDEIRFLEIEQAVLDMHEAGNFPLMKEENIYIPYLPPQPHKKGAKEHTEECFRNTKGPYYDKKRAARKSEPPCDCPVKMSLPQKPKIGQKVLKGYIWDLAIDNVGQYDLVFSDKTEHEDLNHFKKHGMENAREDVLGRLKEKVSTGAEFLKAHSHLDPILTEYANYQEQSKLVSSYLPAIRLATEEGVPMRSRYHILKSTGRTSSGDFKDRSRKLMLPSCNSQQVDPRVRGCYVPPRGVGFDLGGNRVTGPEYDSLDWVFCSIDYTAMELATWSQRCLDLLGYSDCAEKIINKGKDAHQYLGGLLAREFDPDFGRLVTGMGDMEIYELLSELEEHKGLCPLNNFKDAWKKQGHASEPTWKDFYKHYRTFAKPVGLGLPGGLGPQTMLTLAVTVYRLKGITLTQAEKAREVWKGAYREAGAALDFVNTQLVDPTRPPEWRMNERTGKLKKENRYAYLTPGGLYRSNCTYTAAANGNFLQAPGAEGALGGFGKAVRACYGASDNSVLNPDDRGLVSVPMAFVHDEGIFAIRLDGPADDMNTWQTVNDRMHATEGLMVSGMEDVTSGVKAGADGCLMWRWDKKAYTKVDKESGLIVPWDMDDRWA